MGSRCPGALARRETVLWRGAIHGCQLPLARVGMGERQQSRSGGLEVVRRGEHIVVLASGGAGSRVGVVAAAERGEGRGG